MTMGLPIAEVLVLRRISLMADNKDTVDLDVGLHKRAKIEKINLKIVLKITSLNPSQPPFAKGRGNYPPLVIFFPAQAGQRGIEGDFHPWEGDVAVMKYCIEKAVGCAFLELIYATVK